MTDYDERKLKCYCCGKLSKHWELMSSNSFGSRDLDQGPSGMFRSTVASWLQECPYCGYVASSIDKGDARAKSFVDTTEFRAASLDPLAERPIHDRAGARQEAGAEQEGGRPGIDQGDRAALEDYSKVGPLGSTCS